ncbi:glycoside hydrolase family 92 protein [Hymenobacter jejuensis]|uniref:Glycoside hydrolase family 92 protein n=1 Tax=Hymenobacter jejuensis TaxID=2502781 RepID=A0A5B8A5U9_9BACT|nr:glycoside hydrolase family 92 protein [Hymenobacter jejuensis]
MSGVFLLVSLFGLLAVPSHGQGSDVVHYVQSLSGSAPSTTASSTKHGHSTTEHLANTFPAVGVPFGMTQWTPQTRLTETKCVAPYYYADTLLTGFRASHWLSGSCTQDYGSLTIMPLTGKLKTSAQAYATSFSHRTETATPAYYKVALPQYQLSVELTATARCGLMQIVAAQDDSLYVLITPNSDQGQGFVQVDAQKGEVWGFNPVHRIYQGWGQPAGFSGYFVVQLERLGSRAGTYSGNHASTAISIQNQKDIGAFLGCKVRRGETLRLRVGTSFSSLEGARRNLAAEVPNWDFQTLVAQNHAAWQKALAQIRVETSKEQDKRIFYTALYHSLQQPRLFNDVDGTYPAFAGNAQRLKVAKGNYYDDFSMWDIYRAQLPLLELLQPRLANDLVQSMILKGQQGGWLPIFPCWNSYTAAMIGDHGTAFIASAYVRGIRDYDVQEAYRLMRRNAFDQPTQQEYLDGKGRRALPSYLKYGFVPLEDSVKDAFHKMEQVSRTLEYGFDDYALAQVAKGLGKTADYQALLKRSQAYRHIIDPATGLARGRYADGRWYAPFRPDVREFYITEGTPRQYTFYVPHDVPGLAQLMGGPAQLEAKLDSLFARGEYWHGNEPGHQIPFMYNYTAAPWKTQRAVRRILAEEYTDGPGGLSGNDDAGQMSAWYVFASLGLYPLNPASDEYQLCAPLFDRATVQLPGGKALEIIAKKASPEAMYIAGVKWNGKKHPYSYLRHAELTKGGRLELDLQMAPVTSWIQPPPPRLSQSSGK